MIHSNAASGHLRVGARLVAVQVQVDPRPRRDGPQQHRGRPQDYPGRAVLIIPVIVVTFSKTSSIENFNLFLGIRVKL